MGNLTAKSAEGLQVSPHNAPIAHKQLGFPVVFPVELVFDADKLNQGVQKWMWYNDEGEKLMLNPSYTLNQLEKQFFQLHLIVQTLKTEASMEIFYSAQTTSSQQLRMLNGSQQAFDILTRDDFKKTYIEWATQNSTFWCALPGLGGDDLIKSVKAWLQDRNQPTSGSAPHELLARFCALSTMSLKPAPRIMRWAAALKLGLENDPDAAVRMYCRIHLLSDQAQSQSQSVLAKQSQVSQAAHDPFWTLKTELVNEANGNLKQIEMKRLVFDRVWQGPVPGLPLCGDSREMKSQVALFRFKHVGRAFLIQVIDTITNSFSSEINRFDPNQQTARVNDLVFAVLTKKKPIECIRKVTGFNSFTHTQWGKLQDEMETLPVMTLDMTSQGDYKIDNGDPEQYVDYLLEYGFPNLIGSPLFPQEVLRAVALKMGINEQDVADVRKRLFEEFSERLTEPWLESWLEDRKYPVKPEQNGDDVLLVGESRLDTLRKQYLECSRCLYLDANDEACMRISERVSDAVRPNFKMFNYAASQVKVVPVPVIESDSSDIGFSAAAFADKSLIEALHLISDSVFTDDYARLQRLCGLLGVPFDGSAGLNLKVFEVLIARLAPDSALLDVLINMTASGSQGLSLNPDDPKRVGLIRKLQLLTKINQLRREAMLLPEVASVFATKQVTPQFRAKFQLAATVEVSDLMFDNYRSWYGDGPTLMAVVQQRVVIFQAQGKPMKSVQWQDVTSVKLFTFNDALQVWEPESHPPWNFEEAHAHLVNTQGYSVAQVV